MLFFKITDGMEKLQLITILMNHLFIEISIRNTKKYGITLKTNKLI